MARFKLVPPEVKPAMDQLWDCARVACVVIMRSHNWYGLYREYRDEVFDEIVYETVRHFLEFRVRRHTYRRQANDGRPLDFADNVISSCYGVSSKVVDAFMKRLTRLNETADIEPMKFCLSYKDRLPLYVNDTERENRHRPRKMTRVWDRASAVRKEYEDYVLECREWGIKDIIGLGPWMTRNGYKDSELFFYLESKADRKKLLQGQARWLFEQRRDEAEAHLDESTRKQLEHSREYQREYARQRRQRERAEVDRKLREVLGEPPEGYQWFEMKDGRVGQRRIKK